VISIAARSLLFVAVLSSSSTAEAQPCPALEIRNSRGNLIVPGVRGGIPYSGNLALDAYSSPDWSQGPAAIVIHGGAWTSGSRIAHVGQILELLTRAEYNWFSVDYRLGGLVGVEDALADLRAAIAFVRCHATEFDIDPDRLILLGEDSGAHLAALLAAERPAGVVGAVLVGGFYDLAAIPALARKIDTAAIEKASPIRRVVRGVPLLVVHGGDDTEAPVEQARRYCAEMGTGGAGCQFVEVAGASHRSENWWPGQWSYKGDVVRWMSTLAGPLGSRATTRAVTAGLQKDILYSPSTQQKLDAYVPPAAGPVPAVIIAHGGGWEAGDKVTYVTPLFDPLARAGVAWFSIDYRLTPAFTHEDQLDDLRQAIRFVKAEHARFNVDPRRIFLLGESASGQMVSLVGSEDRSLAGIISFYGVYDFTTMVNDASPRSLLVRLFRRSRLDEESREVLRRFSPLYRVHKDMPPVLLINGTGERLWTQAQAYAAALTKVGVRHEVVALEGAPHGLENWEGHPDWTSYKARLVHWVKRALR
jgi:acetyl esterase